MKQCVQAILNYGCAKGRTGEKIKSWAGSNAPGKCEQEWEDVNLRCVHTWHWHSDGTQWLSRHTTKWLKHLPRPLWSSRKLENRGLYTFLVYFYSVPSAARSLQPWTNGRGIYIIVHISIMHSTDPLPPGPPPPPPPQKKKSRKTHKTNCTVSDRPNGWMKIVHFLVT